MNAGDVEFIGQRHKLPVNGGAADDETLLCFSSTVIYFNQSIKLRL